MPLLASYDDHTVNHPYLQVLPSEEWRWGFQHQSNLVMLYQGERPFLLFLGEDREVIARLLEMSKEIAPSARLALPRRCGDLVDGEKSEWDWMAIYRSAELSASSTVVDLGLERDEEIAAFLAEASPTASTQPGSREVVTWHGAYRGDHLVAVGAAIRWKSGAAVLASIATHPNARGEGMATAVTSSLTKMFFDQGEERVSLGLYANNVAARRAYERVGYQLLGEFTSVSR